ncbi:MAG TPA: hypothetical protein PKA80_04590 [Ignavibacteriaceae bacterium]|nr:hypothetical protein [Ignavibacteriaceae bacterium]
MYMYIQFYCSQNEFNSSTKQNPLPTPSKVFFEASTKYLDGGTCFIERPTDYFEMFPTPNEDQIDVFE